MSDKFVELGAAAPAAERQRWMTILAKGRPEELQRLWDGLDSQLKPEVRELRPPEFGLAMVRGRAGGRGTPFNLGEVTVTRCSVRTPEGVMGTSYIMGRDADRARIAATLDAMLQTQNLRDVVEAEIIEPLSMATAKREATTARKTAATKVDFFTMVRTRGKS